MRSLLHRFRSRKLSPTSVNGNGIRKTTDVADGPPKNSDETAAIMDELERTFEVSLTQMKMISEQLKKEMQKGLDREGATGNTRSFVSYSPCYYGCSAIFFSFFYNFLYAIKSCLNCLLMLFTKLKHFYTRARTTTTTTKICNNGTCI
ncbi:hypothetical protein BDB00DRAFT_87515 [Zychaea mexicana]|uniref:uncharacterized protein n=1 Tax=Zychaea mexicana TaxID=64656 RepID=UPI0022FE4DD3|nr:uncharacterized protein BDB00DRAFT_87515 [Zychaea mexicana]KAI9485144.1 hypothetical protein BDB00DRAFT_87515 [Zychaea mexicana]